MQINKAECYHAPTSEPATPFDGPAEPTSNSQKACTHKNMCIYPSEKAQVRNKSFHVTRVIKTRESLKGEPLFFNIHVPLHMPRALPPWQGRAKGEPGHFRCSPQRRDSQMCCCNLGPRSAQWFHNQCEIFVWSHQARQRCAPFRNVMHLSRASSPEKLVDFHAAPAAGRW